VEKDAAVIGTFKKVRGFCYEAQNFLPDGGCATAKSEYCLSLNYLRQDGDRGAAQPTFARAGLLPHLRVPYVQRLHDY
jgi:hypothetical protein